MANKRVILDSNSLRSSIPGYDADTATEVQLNISSLYPLYGVYSTGVVVGPATIPFGVTFASYPIIYVQTAGTTSAGLGFDRTTLGPSVPESVYWNTTSFTVGSGTWRYIIFYNEV